MFLNNKIKEFIVSISVVGFNLGCANFSSIMILGNAIS